MLEIAGFQYRNAKFLPLLWISIFFPFSGLKWHFGIIILFPTYKGVKRYGGQPCFRFDKQSWVVCQWRIGISETHQDITHDLHFSNLNHFLKDIQRHIFFQVNIISCFSQIFVAEMLYNSSKQILAIFLFWKSQIPFIPIRQSSKINYSGDPPIHFS